MTDGDESGQIICAELNQIITFTHTAGLQSGQPSTLILSGFALASQHSALYNFRVPPKLKFLSAIVSLAVAVACFAQEQPSQKQPEVRINYLNVCTPSDADQKEMAAALATIPTKPAFASDFEISRGRSTVTQAGTESAPGPEKPVLSKWVRIRHEFAGGAFSNAQYSFSVDGQQMTETLVLHARDLNKGVLQISFQDTLTTGTPAQVLGASTPVDRIRIERSGKSSLVLARCPGDQSKYQPLFQTGSDIMARFRTALRVQQTVPADLARVGVTNKK